MLRLKRIKPAIGVKTILTGLTVSFLLVQGTDANESLRNRVEKIKKQFAAGVSEEVKFPRVKTVGQRALYSSEEAMLKAKLANLEENDRTVFDPLVLTLEEALDYALKNNLSLQNSYANLEIAHRGVKANRAGIFEPSLQFNVSRGVSDVAPSPILPFGFTSISEDARMTFQQTLRDGTDVTASYSTDNSISSRLNQNQSGAQVKVARTLIGKSNAFFAREIRLKNAKLDEQVSFYQYMDSYQKLVLDVVESYLNTVKAYRQIDVSESVLNSRKELLELTRVKYNLGVSTKLDVLRVEVQVAGEEERLIQARNTYEKSLDSLLNLLNYDRHDGEIKVDASGKEVDFNMEEVQAVNLAMEQRLDLKMARLRLKQAENNLLNTREQIKNKIEANASLQRYATDKSFQLAQDFDNKSWSLGFSYKYPIGNRVARENHHAQKVQVTNTKRNLEAQEDRAGLEVRNAIRDMVSTKKRLDVLEKNLARAKENLKLARLSYEKGIKSSIEVLDAQDDLLEVNKNYINTILDLRIAHYGLRRAMGAIQIPEKLQNMALEWVTGNPIF